MVSAIASGIAGRARLSRALRALGAPGTGTSAPGALSLRSYALTIASSTRRAMVSAIASMGITSFPVGEVPPHALVGKADRRHRQS